MAIIRTKFTIMERNKAQALLESEFLKNAREIAGPSQLEHLSTYELLELLQKAVFWRWPRAEPSAQDVARLVQETRARIKGAR